MLAKNNAKIIKRPLPYNCKDGLDSVTRDRNSPATGKGCLECDLKQFEYHAKYKTNDDRAAYRSVQFPWIVSVSAYAITSPTPHDTGFDISTMRIPASVGSGNFVMQYLWMRYVRAIASTSLAHLFSSFLQIHLQSFSRSRSRSPLSPVYNAQLR